MEESKDNKQRYLKIYDFMISELNLAKYELLIYAYIYSFTEHGLEFTGSQNHLMKKFNIQSNKTVNSVLKNLVGIGLLNKEYVSGSNGRYCSYTANRIPIK